MYEKVISVNGFDTTARYSSETCARVFEPLISLLDTLSHESDLPLTVFIAAPPGAGKSTFTAALCDMAQQLGHNWIALGMDGFHFRSDYLREYFSDDGHLLNDIKGAPCTYDTAKLTDSLKQLRHGMCHWPIYDRRLHDVGGEYVRARGNVFIIEGNWLLLNESPWRELIAYCDLSVFIRADEKLLLPRLVARKVKGGMSESEAERFCMDSDLRNIRHCINNSVPADITLEESESTSGVELDVVHALPTEINFDA